jgi:hypothetical protein
LKTRGIRYLDDAGRDIVRRLAARPPVTNKSLRKMTISTTNGTSVAARRSVSRQAGAILIDRT